MASTAASRSEVPLPSTAALLNEIPLPPANDRIYVDNSNLSELKLTCDEAVERILTRSNRALIPSLTNTPTTESTPISPSSSTSDLSTSSPQAFPPFKASHLHADLRLVLGYIASTVMIGTSLWAFLVEKEWQNNKKACGIAVVVYIVLSSLQAADAYMQGNRIFTGRRKMLSKRIENEILLISSPTLPKPITSIHKLSDGKSEAKFTTPSTYSLEVEYTRKSNGGKSLLRHAREVVTLGHLGEWFTVEGEFVEAIFEAKLLAALQGAIGS